MKRTGRGEAGFRRLWFTKEGGDFQETAEGRRPLDCRQRCEEFEGGFVHALFRQQPGGVPLMINVVGWRAFADVIDAVAVGGHWKDHGAGAEAFFSPFTGLHVPSFDD